MTRLPESPSWEEDIELISRSERVSGGLDGVANRPLKSLVNRTRYLKEKSDKAEELVDEKVGAVKTFEAGAILESPREEILYGAYRMVWTGDFPKTVLAGSSPAGSGGVGAGRWAYTSDAVIRQSLESEDGLRMIGFCQSVAELKLISPYGVGQRITLLGVSAGDVAGGDDFISVEATQYPADNQGVCFSSANPALNWYRLRVLREKIIYLEDFGAIESVVPDMIDCSVEIGAALTWPTRQANGVFKIKSRGCLYKVSSFLGLIDFAYTQLDFDGNVTFYAPTPAGSDLPVTLMEWVMTTRNSVEGAYQGRNLIVRNLSIKATSRETSQVTAAYVHDMWGVSFELNTHGIARSFLMGSNIWCLNILGKFSAQCIFDNSAASTNAGENISLSPGTILYNSGQCADLSHHQFFVNMLGVSIDYTPGRNGKPVWELGNSVVYHTTGHTEYAGPSSAPFARINGDFGGFHVIDGELLLVVNSAAHYDYFAETKHDYQFSIRGTSVFGTRMVGKALCNKKMRYSPHVNIGSTQNISCISDNGGNVLFDPTFSTGEIKDKWHVVGGIQSDRFTTSFAAISVKPYSPAVSGYALKVSKLIAGVGNTVALRLEVKSKGAYLSPRISFKIRTNTDVSAMVTVNLNPYTVLVRDAYGIALSSGRVMTAVAPRSTSFTSMSADVAVDVVLNSIEMVSSDNISPDVFLLDIGLQNLPVGDYYIYDVNYCQGDI